MADRYGRVVCFVFQSAAERSEALNFAVYRLPAMCIRCHLF